MGLYKPTIDLTPEQEKIVEENMKVIEECNLEFAELDKQIKSLQAIGRPAHERILAIDPAYFDHDNEEINKMMRELDQGNPNKGGSNVRH